MIDETPAFTPFSLPPSVFSLDRTGPKVEKRQGPANQDVLLFFFPSFPPPPAAPHVRGQGWAGGRRVPSSASSPLGLQGRVALLA